MTCENDAFLNRIIMKAICTCFFGWLAIPILGCVAQISQSCPHPRSQANEERVSEVGSPSQSIFEIGKLADDAPNVLKKNFSKRVNVFGVEIIATPSTPDNIVIHAASVLAQYLDNDADGKPDDALVVEAMKKNRATLVLFETQRDAHRVFRQLEKSDHEIKNIVFQDLYAEETHPGGAKHGLFDASYEEILHLISHAGYAHAYPDAFGESPGSKLCNAMDVARGGRFLKVPKKYPEQAWYTYDDESCDYPCQATEYLYWGLTSLLGAQDFPGRLAQIDNEWRLNSAEKLKAEDKQLYSLLTDRNFHLPTRLPDGNYQPKPTNPSRSKRH